jgi:serine/threonine protein kinase
MVQEALDVWSLGVMAFELLTGEPALSMHEGKEFVYLLCMEVDYRAWYPKGSNG